jgi:hypothetical protein
MIAVVDLQRTKLLLETLQGMRLDGSPHPATQ